MKKYCIKDLYMETGQIAFKKGKLYECEVEFNAYYLDSEIKKGHRCGFNTELKWYKNFIDSTFLTITPWAKLKLACNVL